jgi:hypothetical protein
LFLDLKDLVPGVVKTVGYRPTGSSKDREGTTPGTNTTVKQGLINITPQNPTQWDDPARRGGVRNMKTRVVAVRLPEDHALLFC